MKIEGEKILIGLSGGINSEAVLCWLIESGMKPSELHLYYAHFDEHSPTTFQFVADGIRLARKHFDNVKVKITHHSILKYFEKQKLIPHPAISPCSRQLKIEPINSYCFENQISIDLIGYVKEELKRRSDKAKKSQQKMFEVEKAYPIGSFENEWCFEIVKKHIGWYPAIYDLRDKEGNRIFKHNNCLPCKNMTPEEFEEVKINFPEHYFRALQLSALLGRHWGRNKDQFYEQFGRDLGQESTCETCKW